MTRDMIVGQSLLLIMTIGVQGMVENNCTNSKMEMVMSGQRFVPVGFDPCTTCTCRNGEAEMCIAVLCSPPKDCLNSQLADNKCCEFMCKSGGDMEIPLFPNVTTVGTKENDNLNTTNLGLRLVASTVTSFLILALLLFMIHRLRQRRLLLMIRRLNNSHLSRGPCPNRRYSMEDDNSVGYFRDRDHVDFGFYEDPPPPYTFWKPPESYFPQGEAPPPYDTVTAPNYLSVAPSLITHPSTPAGLPLRLPSLSSVSLHANNFQMNDLGQESARSDENCPPLPLHHMNVVGSLSSLSSQSELNLNENGLANGADSSMALRSDATYEDCMTLPRNDTRSRNFEHRVSNIANFEECDASEEAQPKRRSLSDVLESWHHCPADLDVTMDLKRRSLQVPVTADRRRRRASRGYYPDPISWPHDASESSSSSSPTFEQRTASPTSSDSSSVDYHFLPTSTDQRRLVMPPRRANSDIQVRQARLISTSTAATNTAEGATASGNSKSNSLDRTLSQLKEKLKKKSKSKNASCKNEVVSDSSKKVASDPVESSAATTSTRLPRLLYVTDSTRTQSDSPVVEPTLNSPCRVDNRPKSYDFGDLSSATETRSTSDATMTPMHGNECRPTDCGCSLSSDQAHSGSVGSVTCSSRASFGSSMSSPASPARGMDETPSSSSSCSSNTPNHYLNPLRQPAHSRSASVCSETGERKYKCRLSLPRDGGVEVNATRIGANVEARRTRAHTSPSGSNPVRISLDLWRQNHESYI